MKIIKVNDCLECPLVVNCKEFKSLTPKQSILIKTCVGVSGIIKTCKLEDFCWTKKRPNKEGYYYIKELEYNNIYVCEIKYAERPDMEGRLFVHNTINDIAELLTTYKEDEYEWCKLPDPLK